MIYLLYGEEQYLVNDELSRITKSHAGASIEKFISPKFSDLIEAISIPSLFSPNRLIIVEDLDFSQENEKFIPSISDLSDSVSLVIKNPEGLDKRSKTYKAIEARSEVHEFRMIPEWEEDKIAEFVKKGFEKQGKKISTDNAYLLVDGAGRNLGILSSEILKISTYAGEKQTIEKEDIEKLMARGGWDAFSLSQAVFLKNRALALKMAENLINDNEDPIALLGLLASQFRTLYKVKLLAGRGDNPSQISRRLKASQFYINKLFENSRIFKLDEIQNAMEAIYYTDLRLKSGYAAKSELSILISDILQNA